MRPVLQGQGLGFPLQGQRRPLRRAENKGCGADVWAQPELLQGGPQSPVPSRCPYLRGQGRHAQPSRRANTRSQHQVHQGPGCLLCAARTMTHRAGGGEVGGRSGAVGSTATAGRGVGERSRRWTRACKRREGSRSRGPRPLPPLVGVVRAPRTPRGAPPRSAPGSVGVRHGRESSGLTPAASDSPAAGDPCPSLPRLPLFW